MIQKYTLSCAAILSVLFGFFGCRPTQEATWERQILAGRVPTDQELARLQHLAIGGDELSSTVLATFYRERSPPIPDSQVIFWEQISAENGSPASMDWLAMYLEKSNGKFDCARAQYWYQ